ncbi:sporulation integral membrane protein YlbJ [Pseudalkalibacillus caeni]|uniref:Sporulation integral membrane protein YlbJ n=2 Tax=Exobacillus caeni TaxID=2574798 RepID=A0A5R9F6F5_9BACL|nr:sporulation integral membrane protein YlbJ [Pseudalkalibacillus caeni]
MSASFTFLACILIIYPKHSLDASIEGLNMWWEVVFPSLLPFFIVSEILIGIGVVRFIGILLEPLMRPVFRVPGVGGFVWAMGLASGFPAGAKFTARLRQERQLTSIEAERLVSFTNCSNPLFIFGAVAVGFFHNASLGLLLAAAHYGGNICVGILMRFHGLSSNERTEKDNLESNRLASAVIALHETRKKDDRPIGKIIGDAVHSSIQTLLMVGGFIILFSVLNELLSVVQVSQLLSVIFTILLSAFHFPADLSMPLLSGLFEITLGSRLTSETEHATLLQQAIMTSFILAFNGFSVQAQVASILAETDIRFQPFFVARILHGCFAAAITLILWQPLYASQQNDQGAKHVFAMFGQLSKTDTLQAYWDMFTMYSPFVTCFALLLFIILSINKLRGKLV